MLKQYKAVCNSHINVVKKYFPNGIDLLFIDGDHSYKGVINDFKNYFAF